MKATPDDEGRQFTAHDDAMKPWRAYAERRMKVFPIHSITEDGHCTCGDSDCETPRKGKHPRIRDWENAATDDPLVIEQWVRRWPDANIGWALGRDGRGAIDVDFRNGGAESFARLEQQLGSLDTSRQISGSGSEHHVVAIPQDITLQSRSQAFGSEFPGVDVKTRGGYIILSPSKHESGGVYTWDAGSPSVQELPRVWVDALLAQQNGKAGERRPIGGVDDGVPLNKGARHNEMIRYAGRCAQTGMDEAQVLLALVVWGESYCNPPYTKAEVETELRAAAESAVRKFGKHADGQAHEQAERAGPIEWADIYTWPEPMRDEAFYGIAGEFVNFIEPHTESDRHAILADLLCGVSAMIGSNPHTAGVSRQQARINVLIVGDTGDGRKGNAFSDACRVLRAADSETLDAILAPGVASSEGLIQFLRTEKDENGTPRLKRAWVREDEYTRLSAAAQRDGSMLSQCLRGAFDGVPLANITKKDPARVTDGHVAISADVTPADLRQDTTETKIANGVVNRFAMVCSKRTKLLPFGGDLSNADLEPIATRLSQAIRHARDRHAVQLSEAAKPEWEEFYCTNETAEHPPLLSAATRRGAQFVLRVALIFALLEMADEIEPGHLRAAIAWWDYCFGSARYVFGARLGNQRADALIEHLRNLHPEKLTSADVDAFFGKNLSANSRQSIRADVVNRGLVSIEKVLSPGKPGRPAELWQAVPPKPSQPLQVTEETDKRTGAAVNPFNPYVARVVERENDSASGAAVPWRIDGDEVRI